MQIFLCINILGIIFMKRHLWRRIINSVLVDNLSKLSVIKTIEGLGQFLCFSYAWKTRQGNALCNDLRTFFFSLDCESFHLGSEYVVTRSSDIILQCLHHSGYIQLRHVLDTHLPNTSLKHCQVHDMKVGAMPLQQKERKKTKWEMLCIFKKNTLVY